MNEGLINFVQFINASPVFKGTAAAAAGLLALLFAYWMKSRWKEPLSGGFLVFIGLAVFIVLFGLYLLAFQPQWWRLPY